MESRRVGWGRKNGMEEKSGQRKRGSLPPVYIIWLTKEGGRDDDR